MYRRFWILLVASLGAALWSESVLADDVSSGAGTLTTNEMIFKCTELEKLNVFNRADTDLKLGHLSSLIMDSHTGQVLYGILDTGIGGNYFIVPWSALQLQKNTNTNKSWLTLAKTSDELKAAPVFDKSKSPDFASVQWREKIGDFFGVQTARPPEGTAQLAATDLIFRSNDLEAMKVVNRADGETKLGHLNDLIINAHTGQVMYGILDTGLFGKYIPVPWNAFEIRQDKDKNSWLALNKTSDELKNAPSFDMKVMPDVTNTAWQEGVDRFFGVRMAARPRE
ncbi:MAG: PRC-barrel domain-containing protein [Thermoguttaceae bacterium]